jgi:hypothetical protein
MLKPSRDSLEVFVYGGDEWRTRKRGIEVGERDSHSSKQLKVLEVRDMKRRLQVEFATRFATRKFLDIDSVEKSGGERGIRTGRR